MSEPEVRRRRELRSDDEERESGDVEYRPQRDVRDENKFFKTKKGKLTMILIIVACASFVFLVIVGIAISSSYPTKIPDYSAQSSSSSSSASSSSQQLSVFPELPQDFFQDQTICPETLYEILLFFSVWNVQVFQGDPLVRRISFSVSNTAFTTKEHTPQEDIVTNYFNPLSNSSGATSIQFRDNFPMVGTEQNYTLISFYLISPAAGSQEVDFYRFSFNDNNILSNSQTHYRLRPNYRLSHFRCGNN